jgi:hypothetical protein
VRTSARARQLTGWPSQPAPGLHDGPESRILSVMAKEPERFDPKERAREKQRSREDDARALASGEKSPEELQRENGHFSFPNARVSLRGSKPLE